MEAAAVQGSIPGVKKNYITASETPSMDIRLFISHSIYLAVQLAKATHEFFFTSLLFLCVQVGQSHQLVFLYLYYLSLSLLEPSIN